MTSGLGAVLTYSLLTALWGAIVVLYARLRRAAASDAVIRTLLAVLLLDAVRSLVESMFFGLVWGANFGLLPASLKVLSSPQILTAVKWFNVLVAVTVLGLLIRRWVPAELARRQALREDEARLQRELETSLRATQESEERFRLAASASRDAVWDWDLATGVVFSSARMPEMLGYPAQEWAPSSEPWLRVVHPDDLERARAHIARFIRGELPTFDLRWRALHRDGRTLSLQSSGVLVKDDRGRALRFAGFVRDVTDEVTAEAQRLQTQKLEGLGLLAGGVAHDFNNLLMVISSSLQLAGRLRPGADLSETLSTASLAVERAAMLTRQLLAYAGHVQVSHRPIDLNHVVKAISELLSVSAPPGVKLSLDLAAQLPLVQGDDGQLQQVVMNLVSNACEAIGSQGGTVTISTRQATLTEQAPGALGAPPLGPVVTLVVRDTGPGISADVEARMFDPFFSTRGPGRGLGLSAVSGVLRAHEGSIALTSTPGQGTTFTVTLPALDAGPQPAPQPAPRAPRVDDAPLGARILLVDDAPLLRRSARALLQVMGCTVDEAANGAEAVEKVRATPAAWDMVLMDVTMPEMDGYEAARQISALAPALAVVLSSGYSARADDRGLPAGIRTLDKPYNDRQLAAMIREVLAARSENVPGASPSR